MINKGLGLNEDGSENTSVVPAKKSSLFSDLFSGLSDKGKKQKAVHKDSFEETKVDEYYEESDNDSDWGLEDPALVAQQQKNSRSQPSTYNRMMLRDLDKREGLTQFETASEATSCFSCFGFSKRPK